jgi:hypothetical protein
MVSQERDRLAEELEEVEAERRRLDEELQTARLNGFAAAAAAVKPEGGVGVGGRAEEGRLRAEVSELQGRLITMEGDHAVLLQQLTAKGAEKGRVEAELKVNCSAGVLGQCTTCRQGAQ